MTDSRDLELLRQSWLADHGEQRRIPRQPLFRPQLTWLRAQALGPEPVCADLVDASSAGVCLALASPCPLQPGDAVEIGGDGGPPRAGRVRWREQTAVIVAVGVAYEES